MKRPTPIGEEGSYNLDPLPIARYNPLPSGRSFAAAISYSKGHGSVSHGKGFASRNKIGWQ